MKKRPPSNQFLTFGLCALPALVLGTFACEMNSATVKKFNTGGSSSQSVIAGPSSEPNDDPEPTSSPSPSSTAIPDDFSLGAITVCPQGCDHTTATAALAAVRANPPAAGAVIEVVGGDYNECLSIQTDKTTIRGVKGRPHFHTKIDCHSKGIITVMARDTVLENLEISDFSLPDYTGAGVRMDGTAFNLTMRNMHLHDGQFGLLGSSKGDTIIIENSLFEDIGYKRPDGEISVPIFIGSDSQGNSAKKLLIRSSSILSPRDEASEIKSRAEQTIIDCSVIANLNSPDSYNIDLQFGGDVILTNNVIEQSSLTLNNRMISYASSNWRTNLRNRLVIHGNKLINDASNVIGVAFGTNRVPSEIDVTFNEFIGIPAIKLFSGGGSESNNLFFGNRGAAALGAYPLLPAPGACGSSDLYL